MKRISAAILTLVLVLGTVGSVAAQNDAEKIKIGMANLSLCCPYFIGMSEAVEQEASVYDNVQVLVTNADGDVEKLTSDIEDLIAKKVDGIVLSGAFINAAPQALAAIKEAGIPVVMVDRLLTGGDYTSWVGPDNHAIGVQDGEFIVEQLAGAGKLGVIRGGPADNTIGSDRTDGMLSQVEPTEIEVITYPDFAGWSTDGGFTAAETLLAQNPDLNAIFCENDSMCLGAQKVIEDQGLADQVFVVGVDGETAALVEIMKDGVYKATGLNSSDQIG
ncbi:MAG TPA: substrate-binding domain-containing protein, partial [Candidatus Deferrimicrobium sp.]|nr:substrate-binding domain-containing protein [Candidatus Deferrimicrobium sp.]